MRSFVLASAAVVATSTSPHHVPNKVLMFKEFKETYSRHYATEFEEGMRFRIFSENVDKIYTSNAQNKSYTLGVTANADRTFNEWKADHLHGFKPTLSAEKKNHARFTAPKDFAEPDSIDWTTKGGVTEVKNQGTCGSCWTFSATGALEGAMFVAGRPLQDLGNQHILACDKGSSGCKGGSMDQAFDWVSKNGMPSLKTEPYLCVDGTSAECTGMTCKTEAASDLVLAVGDVVKHTDVDTTENALEAAVAQQPVSVAIEADQDVFQHYTSGVLTNDACGSTLDHGVLAVGYGTDGGKQYWKVKNSWGTTFGENGYIRIEKGSASDGGECGIRKMASFPTVKAASADVIV